MDRYTTVSKIEQRIGDRRLIWLGTRGTDAQPLLQIEQFVGVFGLISPLGVPSWQGGSEVYLEHLCNQRVDLNTYSIDDDRSDHVAELARQLRAMLVPGTIVTTYRPTAFLAAAYYPRLEHADYLGMFHGAQTAYEHKPWVETEMQKRGVATIPWRYFADDDHSVLHEWVDSRTCVLRANYSDGGAALALTDPGSAEALTLPDHPGGFIAVAPYLTPTVPLNVSGCVFPDGTVTVRHPSLQLIGIPDCTTRRFGYCGNDFAVVSQVLGRKRVNEFEQLVHATGKWLSEAGYIGAFGLDALLYGDDICLTEVNPRFQGSSALAASIACATGMADVYLDHLCAHLGLGAPEQPSLWEQATQQSQAGHRKSQVVCYNTGDTCTRRDDSIVPDLDYGDLRGVAEHGISVLHEAMLFKLCIDDSVTTDGFCLSKRRDVDVRPLVDLLYEPASQPAAALGGERT